ncbi:molybdopterin-dependent oxidoreductase [Planctomyces sp. SH-PL62]|uniref:molybdopterin-containing oxidoreductase family protein n=1 Tax=Planctomyces sp. SH-PL62 TaxID=1636152 RepID=UPI00078C044C|nr:molybdopterin oxidoreductase family protein [Planctomyces sp. SH-PL62]AMV38785.1 Acetylene hydratase [Planctomyces sp. SH-PL62]
MPPETTVFKNVCPLDCPDTCSMLVTVRNGVAVELKGDPGHPFTRGFLCRKMARYLDRVYSDHRLMHPMKRIGRKGEGRFERISWDEALATIAERFRAVADSPEGPQAILPYSYYGTMGKLQASSLDRRFFHRLGASKLDRTICASAGSLGYEYTLGRGRLGADPLAVPGCKFLVNWGSNTVNTNSHLWSLMIEARKKNGATIVTVDPYRSPTAERSDWHIQPRPGTDAALALGLMHVLWRDGLADEDYLARATVGADLLRERVLNDYPPDRTAAITGLDVETITTFAHRLAREQPSLIRLNYGMQRHHGGGMAVRTIACLPAVVGSWRHAGGGALLSTSGAYNFDDARLARPDLSPAGTRTVNMNQLGEALAGELPGPRVDALYVYNSNPAAVAPNQAKVLRGLAREDLFTVVHELFATDTVDYADVVLPATSQLEHVDVHGSYGHHEVMYNPRSIEPRGECRSNNDVFRALAARLGFEPESFPDDETLMREALDGGPTLHGVTLERLEAEGSVRLNLPEAFAPFADGVFPTPSGKCELYSERMARDGLDPLPTYIPPLEDPQTRPDLAARFPIQLLSPPRPQFLNSTFANSPRHRDAAGEPTVEMAAEDAQARGVADGDRVEVFNARGSFQARVALTGGVRPGVAVAAGIYWSKLSPGRSNANATTSSALSDMGGGATFFDNLVQIRPIDEPTP